MLKALGIIGTGTLGILAAGLLISNIFQNGLEWIFATGIFIFVVAGAIALIAKSLGRY